MSELIQAPPPVAPKVVLNTSHARAMLRKRFAPGEWALMEEVAPSTGGGTTYADAVAVNLWSSRGHAVHGVEIKVSRSDWLRELKKPAKAEGVFGYCNYWWIVAPAGVVNAGELPPTWGHLELRAAALVQTVPAPKLKPKPIDLPFFASLMRRGHEQIDEICNRRMHDVVQAAHAQIDERIRAEVEQRSKRYHQLEAEIADFTEKTGLAISPWRGPPIEAIQLATRLADLNGWGDDTCLGKLTGLADSLQKHAETLRAAVAECGLTAAPHVNPHETDS